METCDISLVKQEIVEIIKTEPQNEDEFDTCGQSGIKTEDSNLVGFFKDTINDETHNFQTTDVKMKSLWDGFLTIKEPIKDESDTSNSVNGIVKTEIKLFDSSFGMMDMNIDNFTPVDKSEIKLEQGQATLSSEILQSNIIAQTSSDFNLNTERVNEIQDLSFNALHKKAVCRNTLLNISCCESKEKFATEYKTSFLNSDQIKYRKEHQGSFSEGLYKIQVCSNNHLTGEEYKDSLEIISSKDPKLGGFCVPTEKTDTKYKLEKFTKKVGNGIADVKRWICKTKNCTKYALKGGNCNAHGGGRKCKTEKCTKNAQDSNLVGNFKDTINDETHNFQTSEVEMKSPWDGFLPIKEQIKDESDTSNSVDEIVKTEIKLFDSSFGIMDTNIDHFTPVDKSEVKLEQDQDTLSSEILQSNIIAPTSSDFNSNIERVNQIQDLSFNALHKKAECRNNLLNISCCESNEKLTTEYKTYFLNSDLIKYRKEHQGSFSEGLYKIQTCSDNHLTGEDTLEIISSKDPKLGGFCVSTETTNTKYKLEKYTKKEGNGIADGKRWLCKTKNCTKYALKGENCNALGGGRKCKTEKCKKIAQLRGHCIAHGGRRICKTEKCIKNAQLGGHCTAHGGGRKCITENCTKLALLGGHCIAHGGGRKCETVNCTKRALLGGHCIEHGGGRKCKTEKCTKSAQLGGHCIAHGGGRKCKTEKCTKIAQSGGHCYPHGGGSKCKTVMCTKNAKLGGHCISHGGGRKCKTEKCTKSAQLGGHCIAHVAGR